MSNAIVLRILASVALIGTVAVNALANILPINGLNTGEVSNLYPSLFTPAGITFSIWTLIYALLIGFVIYMWAARSDDRFTEILVWFSVTCLLNMSWILVWHNLLPTVSVVIMLGLLFSLLRIFLLLPSLHLATTKEILFVRLPFTLYFAWICVATIANVSALLVSLEWNGGFLSPESWTALMMGVAALLAVKIVLDYGAPSFVLVVMWALLGIYLRWKGTDHHVILVTAIVLEVLLLITLFFFFKRRKVA